MPSSKRRTHHGFDQRVGNKHETKTTKNTVTENDVISANEQQHHNSPYLPTASDANVNKDNMNSKTLNFSSAHKSKARDKRARNRSLEMVIDDDKADSSPSRSRYVNAQRRCKNFLVEDILVILNDYNSKIPIQIYSNAFLKNLRKKFLAIF